MERTQINATRFRPTRHAAQRLRERFHPTLSERQAFELLVRIAKGSKPLKVRGTVTG